MTNLDRRARRIQAIASETNRLSAELDSLMSLSDNPLSPPASSLPLDFVPGDRVEILNNHHSFQGSRGTVLRTNLSFVFFRLDLSNEVVWRSCRNLRLLLPS